MLPQTKLNLKLIEDFELSDTALVTYAAICKIYRLTDQAPISVTSMNQILFGTKQNHKILFKAGIDELIEKNLIQRVQVDTTTCYYNTETIANYPSDRYVWVNLDHLVVMGAKKKQLGGLFRTYCFMKYLIDNSETGVVSIYKNSFAKLCSTNSVSINTRLDFMKKNKIFSIEDFSSMPVTARKKNKTLFVSNPEKNKELYFMIDKCIPKSYRNGVNVCTSNIL